MRGVDSNILIKRNINIRSVCSQMDGKSWLLFVDQADLMKYALKLVACSDFALLGVKVSSGNCTNIVRADKAPRGSGRRLLTGEKVRVFIVFLVRDADVGECMSCEIFEYILAPVV